ncbi:SWIM zinc finger family protein [Brevibacillus centrosporus]
MLYCTCPNFEYYGLPKCFCF